VSGRAFRARPWPYGQRLTICLSFLAQKVRNQLYVTLYIFMEYAWSTSEGGLLIKLHVLSHHDDLHLARLNRHGFTA
jgi:hypothetical protein